MKRYRQVVAESSPPPPGVPTQRPAPAPDIIAGGGASECEVLKRAASGQDPVVDGPVSGLDGAKLPGSLRWPGAEGDGVSYSVGQGRYTVSYHVNDYTQPGNRADELQAMFIKQVQKCLPASSARGTPGFQTFCVPGSKKIVSIFRQSGLGDHRWAETMLAVGLPNGPKDRCP